MSDFISDDLEIINLLTLVVKSGEKVWIWETNPETNERSAHLAKLIKFNIVDQYLELRPIVENGLKFNSFKNLFFYSQKQCFAFKLEVRKFEDSFIGFYTPKKVRQVSPDFYKAMKLVDIEDEVKFMHMRQVPRKTAAATTVGISHNLDHDDGPINSRYELYDMSQGGLAFVCLDPGEFAVNSSLEITDLNGKVMGSKLRGTIMSIRKIEDEDSPFNDQFKVGVKFD